MTSLNEEFDGFLGSQYDTAITAVQAKLAPFLSVAREIIVARNKCSLDIFWLKDESPEYSANLPEPHVLAKEIADDLWGALEQIESDLIDLQQRAESAGSRK